MPMYDFKCNTCGLEFDDIVSCGVIVVLCPNCSNNASKIFRKAAVTLTAIIPSYPGCLKKKAGYVHSHGDKPSKKLQSGYGGCTKPNG